MPYTRRSRLKEIENTPMGHDALQLLVGPGRGETLLSRLAGNVRISALDRLMGRGTADLVLQMVNSHPAAVPPALPEQPVWWRNGVIYHIYLPSFMDADHDGVGDLDGVRQRLPYLRQLGVDALWLWPVLDTASFGEQGIRDFREIDAGAGGMEAFEALLEAVHAWDMKLVIGFSIEGTSEQHDWFLRTQAGEEACREYYVLHKTEAKTPPNNWTDLGGTPGWKWFPEMSAWGMRFAGQRVGLNWEAAAVREEICDVMRFWQKKGVDGICLGSANSISRGSLEDGSAVLEAALGVRGAEHYLYGPRLGQYLGQLRAEGLCSSETFLMGETWGVGPEFAKTLAGTGAHLDMAMDTAHLCGEARVSLQGLKAYYLSWMEHFADKRGMPLVLENPHIPRIVGRLGEDSVYRGMLAKLLGTMQLTLRGTPFIYQGQELGLPGVQLRSAEELRHSTSLRVYAENVGQIGEKAAMQKVVALAPEHARAPMPWSAGPGGGFTGAEPWMRLPEGAQHLHAAAQMQDNNSVWHHYRRLIMLRKENPCLVWGSFNPVFAKNKNVFCYFRISEGAKWYVEMNITGKVVGHPGRILSSMKLEHSNYEAPARALRPFEANLYRCE